MLSKKNRELVKKKVLQMMDNPRFHYDKEDERHIPEYPYDSEKIANHILVHKKDVDSILIEILKERKIGSVLHDRRRDWEKKPKSLEEELKVTQEDIEKVTRLAQNVYYHLTSQGSWSNYNYIRLSQDTGLKDTVIKEIIIRSGLGDGPYK